MAMGGFPKRRDDGGVTISGVDHGGVGRIMHETDEYVVVLWPAHSAWAGRGERCYQPASYAVYEKTKQLSDGFRKKSKTNPMVEFWEVLLDWDHTRKKKDS